MAQYASSKLKTINGGFQTGGSTGLCQSMSLFWVSRHHHFLQELFMNDPIKIGESDDWMGRMGGLTDDSAMRRREIGDGFLEMFKIYQNLVNMRGPETVVDFQFQRFSEFEDDWVHVVHVWKILAKNCQ